MFSVIQLLPYVSTAGTSPHELLMALRKLMVRGLVFSGLRVYALSDRNIMLSTLVVCLSLVPIPINSVRAPVARRSRLLKPELNPSCQYLVARHIVLTQESNVDYRSYCLISLDIPMRLVIECALSYRSWESD